MPKKTYTTLPSRFGTCLHDNCPMASTCLRQVAYSMMTDDKDLLCMVNPRHCSKGKDCKFYRDATPARYAKGFTNFQKKMFPEQYRDFMSTLIVHFGRSAGVKEDFHFDKYLDLYNWFD